MEYVLELNWEKYQRNRDFYSSTVNNVYVGDITYIPTVGNHI